MFSQFDICRTLYPEWKKDEGGLAAKFALWKLYFENSRKIKNKIKIKNYIESLQCNQMNKLKIKGIVIDERLPANTFTVPFSHFDCEFTIQKYK